MDAKWLILIATIATWSQVEGRGSPPIFRIPGGNQWPNPNMYIRKSTAENATCLAEGSPKPKYMWMKEDTDGTMREVANNAVVFYNRDNGNLTLSADFKDSYNGNYSCIAYNSQWKAVTPPLSIEAIVFDSFPGKQGQDPEKINKYMSQRLDLGCKNLETLDMKPAPKIAWFKEQQFETTELTSQERYVIDPKGTLHFLWLWEGMKDGKIISDFNAVYYCKASHGIQGIEAVNTHSIDLQKTQGNTAGRSPELVYAEDVTAMVGTEAKLTCIFSYFSPAGEKLKITWFHQGQHVGEGWELTKTVLLPNKTQDMSGEYMCQAQLGRQLKSGRLNLKIISPPTFNKDEKLMAKSVPIEKDAVFKCGASSYEAHQEAPVWYVNAEKILECNGAGEMACPERKLDGTLKCVAKCDGLPECTNGEDEEGCPRTCSEGEKLCDGQCVPANRNCPACVYPKFKCAGGCLNKIQICDGKKDCDDGLDEANCPGGDPIREGRFILSSDRRELTLPSVTMSDEMCFMCTVTNQYGTLYGDGCLTVIRKIEVEHKPNDTYNVEPGQYINIFVSATTDLMYENQMGYNWLMWNVTEVETGKDRGTVIEEPIRLPSGVFGQYFATGGSGQNFTMIIPDVKQDDENKDKYEAYMALTDSTKYAVNISHPFEEVLINFTVIGVEILPPVVEPVVQASFNPWLIAIILAVAVLFIVIALIICYMYRNRGGTYPLDKKEHQAGHDPAQELKDSAFRDVGRVDDEYDDDKNRPETASLSESVKPYYSDEDETAEYAEEDLDLSRFNEEGSFIFQYGDKKSKAKEATV